jgi:hypothetical protein
MKLLRDQLEQVRNLAEKIAAGTANIDGRVRDFSRRGAQIGRIAFWSVTTKINQVAGKTEMIRILGDSEHCPDCEDYAAQQWQPIGSLPMPGVDSVCGGHCRCTVDYR